MTPIYYSLADALAWIPGESGFIHAKITLRNGKITEFAGPFEQVREKLVEFEKITPVGDVKALDVILD